MERLIDITTLAEILGVGKATVYAWVHYKKIPYIKIGSLVRFREADINEWLAKRSSAQETASEIIKHPKQKAKPKRKSLSGSSYVDDIIEKAKAEVLDKA